MSDMFMLKSKTIPERGVSGERSNSKSSDTSIDTPPLYPTGLSHREMPRKKTRNVIGYVIESKPSSFFYISRAYESLNYVDSTNQLEMARQKLQTYPMLILDDILRIVYFIAAGMLTAIIGVILEYSIEIFGHVKYTMINTLRAEYQYNGRLSFSFNSLMVCTTIFIFISIPIMIGCILCIYVAPYAAGGGVAQCIAYLNGIKVPNVLSITGLIVKIISTTCTCISGLAGGKEGPMMHMGAIVGGILPSALPFLQFRIDRERRDFASGGFGAGIAVVFGAPIGGLLLAVEEGVSFWELALMWRIYLCCVSGYAFATIVFSILIGVEVRLNNSQILSMGTIHSNVTNYELFEIIPFALMGIIGGSLGAVLTKIHIYLVVIRNKYITSKFRKVMFSVFGAFVVSFFHVIAIEGFPACSKLTEKEHDKFGKDNVTRHVHQLYCADDEHSDMSVLFSQTQGDLMRTFFGTEILQASSLFVFSVIYFILLCMTMVTYISAGLFVPQIILGAAWGRMIGTIIQTHFPNAHWAVPAKYAYMGAAAQLSGTIGRTFSILVLMVEAANSISFSFPLMIIVSITRIVNTFFVLPIYETQMHLMGLPYLPAKPPPVRLDIPSSKVMSEPPLRTLPPTPTVDMILSILRMTNHNGFPIVTEEGRDGEKKTVLLGLILRQQLLVLLKYKAYKYPTPKTDREMIACLFLFMKVSRKKLDIQVITDSVKPKYYSNVLDLSPYYNQFPFIVSENMPVLKTYNLFRSLGLRHLIVVSSEKQQPIAMITRKDLAKYHTFETYLTKGVKKMIVK